MYMSDLFPKKRPAEPGDWMYEHPEDKVQTVDDFRRELAESGQKVGRRLYVQPVELAEGRISTEVLSEYLRVFFWGLEAEVLPELRFDCKETDAPFIFPGIDQGVRHRIFDGDLQLYARDVIRVMSVIKGRMPDAKCVVAVTSIDLYPAESWNFVFGLASKKNGVGVFSFARFAARNRMVELARCLKLMVHETSHMLGLTHCQTYACVMNGVNNIREADLCPMYLCPLCLEKMSLAQPSLDVVERYRQLSAFCSKIGLTEMESWCVRRLESLLPAPSVPVPPSGEVLANAFCQMDLKGEELSGNLGCK